MNGRIRNVSAVQVYTCVMRLILMCGLWLVLVPLRCVSGDLAMPQSGHRRSNHKPQIVSGKYANFTWPNRELASKIEGEIIIGALHMIHERSEDLICGAIMPDGGIQALEVMLYTLDHINNDPHFLPGITLGVLAKDDCDRDIYGLEQAVDFIRAKTKCPAMVVRIEGGPKSETCVHLHCHVETPKIDLKELKRRMEEQEKMNS